MKLFEDFKEGDLFQTPARTLTDADVINFAGVSGDFYPLHTDDVYARKSIYKSRIAHGALMFSVMTGLWTRLPEFQESIIAFYGADGLRFVKPVYINDTVRMKVKVTAKEEHRIGGLLVLDNEMLNQRDEVVMVCKAKLLVRRRD